MPGVFITDTVAIPLHEPKQVFAITLSVKVKLIWLGMVKVCKEVQEPLLCVTKVVYTLGHKLVNTELFGAAGLQLYEYGATPPVVDRLIEPLQIPLHVGSLILALMVMDDGCVMLVPVNVLHPRLSSNCTEYPPGVVLKPEMALAVTDGAGNTHTGVR
jgi:hypothetical protein